jgi:hypothetical protein
MEGFWIVRFTGVQGFGAGVLTLIGGQIFGGDGGMLYSGTYNQTGNTMQAHVHVTRHTSIPGVQSVIGTDDFYLDLTGTLQGNTLAASGTIPGTQLKLNAALTKQAELPIRR